MNEKQKNNKIRRYIVLGGIIIVIAIIAMILFGKQPMKSEEDVQPEGETEVVDDIDAEELEVVPEEEEAQEEEIELEEVELEEEEPEEEPIPTLEKAVGYWKEQDYKEAEKYFQMAIEEEPKQMEGYVKLAELYLEQGNIEKTEEMLKKGEDQGAEGFREDVERIRKTITDSADYLKAYADKIHEYEDKYGKAEIVKYEDDHACLKGLSFMKLVDFDQNATEELLLVYSTFLHEEDGRTYNYEFEVWGYEDGKEILLDSGTMYASDGGWTPFNIAKEKEQYRLMICSPKMSGAMDAHGYSENGFGVVPGGGWKEDSVKYKLNYYIEECEVIVKQNEATKLRLGDYY